MLETGRSGFGARSRKAISAMAAETSGMAIRMMSSVFMGMEPQDDRAIHRSPHPIDVRRVSSPSNKEFALVTLSGDEHGRAEYDISDLHPASLRGRVMLNGTPAANRRIHLARMREVDGGPFVHVGSTILTTDSSGNFTAEGIHPGRYGLSISSTTGQSRGVERLVCPEAVDIAPGSQVSRVFRIHTGQLEVHVTNSEGKPVRGQFVIHNPQNGFRTRRESDAQGVLRVEEIAAGNYTISVTHPEPGPHAPGGSRLRPSTSPVLGWAVEIDHSLLLVSRAYSY